MIAANGTIAMRGIDNRHSSQLSPMIMSSQCELGADARLSAARNMTKPNGNITSATGVLYSPPGCASLNSATEGKTRDPIVKRRFNGRGLEALDFGRSV